MTVPAGNQLFGACGHSNEYEIWFPSLKVCDAATQVSHRALSPLRSLPPVQHDTECDDNEQLDITATPPLPVVRSGQVSQKIKTGGPGCYPEGTNLGRRARMNSSRVAMSKPPPVLLQQSYLTQSQMMSSEGGSNIPGTGQIMLPSIAVLGPFHQALVPAEVVPSHSFPGTASSHSSAAWDFQGQPDTPTDSYRVNNELPAWPQADSLNNSHHDV